jgi:hypothetical protein
MPEYPREMTRTHRGPIRESIYSEIVLQVVNRPRAHLLDLPSI